MAEHEKVDNDASPRQPQKRPGQSSGAGPTRSKRAKYTPMACNECKKRKLKCNRNSGRRQCQRCQATNTVCIYAGTPPPFSGLRDGFDSDRYTREVEQLRQEVSVLASSLKELTDKVGREFSSMCSPSEGRRYPVTTGSLISPPKEPQFVGHTRPDFSLRMVKTALIQMGISTDATLATSTPTSRASTPEPHESSHAGDGGDPLLSIPRREILRLIDVYQEGLLTVYPVIDVDTLTSKINWVFEAVHQGDGEANLAAMGSIGQKDMCIVKIVKIVLATSIVLEAQGKNELSQKLVDSIECGTWHLARESAVDLRDIQVLTILSIYYFQCDEELFAWRTIGMAARMTLEMGLHRKRTLIDNFNNAEDRAQANRTFWCVYVLDRRWSFGTGLSFALVDGDIDPQLPQPAPDFQYLRCLIRYGRLCSNIWGALPPLESPSNEIPRHQVQYLEYLTQNWISSIPTDLQFRHPRPGLALSSEPRTLRRLRALLYLRGNYIRTLLYRHHVLSTAQIYSDTDSAQLVVEVAKDSIQVLVDLAKTSDIYRRQQVVFNHFLLSALAVMLLAVCHAPDLFSEPCRDSFSSTVELVRGFSRESAASKRLWRSIRGLLPAVKTLRSKWSWERDQAGRIDDRHASVNISSQSPHEQFSDSQPKDWDQSQTAMQTTFDGTEIDLSSELCASVPDMYDIGNDLMDLFNAFGQVGTASTTVADMDQPNVMMGYPVNVSRRFNDLI
ncbi:fungal-specific transcription factor domain-containing protein [Pseudomassariella vexata]|uniref:Fungal-specific transcription factor domain-domain-containing protein n=1 Tax=Pseudomassariella vexata TaxID=1141098 RepID=A0A1Y2DXE5_9PEZI|nr:fungal-specific transcription factor domain-containing protein [Pseudomassariella vexata]ORY63917.1 fungal-specific transcription factor domain-domain-containing protein [Pseudomassariella vexata]